ncbi:lysosomal alpha-glucosidase-like [Periplaneta americana]|uniref:lysosomal alpha-glucosidase-like n=1 Tax=Periplaneta americana TaxID=6978 RepID=UPI0037E87EFF
MQGPIKNILKRITIGRSAKTDETQPIESSFNDLKMSEDTSSVLKETSGPEFNRLNVRYSSTTKLTPADESKCPRPNISTFLILLLVIILFMVIPIINLLHFFHLLNSQWPADEFNRVMTDHSHSNPRKEVLQERENTVVFHNIMRQIVEKVAHNNSVFSSHIRPPSSASFKQCAKILDDFKFDCYPEGDASETRCKARGCCWVPKKKRLLQKNDLNVPYCYYPPAYGGYKFINITKTLSGSVSFLQRTFKSPYPDDVSLIRMDIRYESEQRLHIKIVDPLHSRFEPPYPEVPVVEHNIHNTDYEVLLDKNKTGFKVVRKSDNQTLFDAQDVGAFIFADQFLQLSAVLPSSYVYGLGEHRSPLLLSTRWQRFTMFNHDQIPKENTNLYGSHPFYLVMEKSGKSHGVFLLNSNAMEVILQPAPAVTFRTLGGLLDFFIFLGPSPQNVIQQYTEVIGRPYMPPYWGLGFHLCRFGYKSLNDTKNVLNRTRKAGIPLDVQWNDLDYMERWNDFTYDKEKFKGLPEFVNELHQAGMHYIPLIDPGVSASEEPGTYPPYDDGLQMDIFIKNSTGQPFVGKVWNPVSTVWPDFTHPRTVDYWLKQLKRLHKEFQFDGAWIDMNEPSNFWSGSATGCPDNNLERPPYFPSGINGGKLYYHTVCMSSSQYAGHHYDVHNLYGFTEAIVTSFAMAEIREKRPFVISRSTFAGHGQYAGHWSGDIVSNWYDMKMTIPQLLNFGMFGIPLMGADICGFNGNTTPALCQRWSQLGAFYPFSRNHNTDDGIPQDPVALGPAVVQSARKSLLTRYSLLPYLYTLFWKAHMDGDTVARPLFFEFPSDVQTYSIDEQFLWGSALMIIPVLEEGKKEVAAYLPDALWYDFYTLALVPASGKQHTLPAPLDTIPLLIRGGSIIPTQAPNMTTTESRKNYFELLIALDKDGLAEGTLYWDDGDSLNSYADRRYNLVNFTLAESKVTGSVMWWGYDDAPPLGKVTVLGIQTTVKSVFVNQASKPFSYDTINKFLKVENLKVPLNDTLSIHWV